MSETLRHLTCTISPEPVTFSTQVDKRSEKVNLSVWEMKLELNSQASQSKKLKSQVIKK